MIPLPDISLFILLVVMTYYDFSKQAIPNYIIAILWILFAGLHGNFAAIPIYLVGFIMLLNFLSYKTAKQEVLAWGDVLVLPIVFAWFWALTSYNLSFMAMSLAFITGTIVALVTKTKIPLVAYLGIFYLIIATVVA